MFQLAWLSGTQAVARFDRVCRAWHNRRRLPRARSQRAEARSGSVSSVAAGPLHVELTECMGRCCSFRRGQRQHNARHGRINVQEFRRRRNFRSPGPVGSVAGMSCVREGCPFCSLEWSRWAVNIASLLRHTPPV